MIVAYFRSSSYNRWDWCAHLYMLEYVLGMKFPANQAADRGSIVHKGLELLARKKLSIQNGDKEFTEPELQETFAIDDVNPNMAIERAFHYYTEVKETVYQWTAKDLTLCRQWMWDVLEFNDGMFSPLKRHVLAPEQYFNFEIDKPWAKYSYALPDGKILEGHLAVKGTIDLVTQVKPGTIEYIDWKTGARKDWVTGKIKEHKDLCNDPQLRLYHYALCKLYPDVENIIVTIFFVKDGGPYTICFQRKDVPETERMLQRRFEAIRNTQRPRLNKSWRCTKLCHAGKNQYPDSGKTICEHMKDELQTLGLDKLMQKYGQPGAFSNYGEGGGQSNREAT